jgi:sensor histidine kinase YesM
MRFSLAVRRVQSSLVTPDLDSANDFSYDSDMKTLIQKTKAWYQRWDEKALASLPPDTRQDVLAFNVMWAKHKWRYLAIATLVWFAAATIMSINLKLSWFEALAVTFLVLFSLSVGLMSAWFGHFKFKLTLARGLSLILLAVAGAIFGAMIASIVKGSESTLLADLIRKGPGILLAGFIVGVIYTAIIALVVHARRKQLEVRNQQLEQQTKAAELARQLADARLKLMQAQVEPHFLFNTLASVQHLAEPNAPEAARLTRDLITFLRAGLGGLRDDTTTVQREFEMAAAYLAIMQTRMGERLQYAIDLPEALANKTMPPAMLITLVENAIKHGVEPATDGGTIKIMAHDKDGALNISVQDTGLGLRQKVALTGGVGLTNIRERLHAIFGEAAKLIIEENPPRGVTATISIANKTEIKV